VYTAVYGPCTRPCTGRVSGREQPCTRSTAVFTVRTRGTRPSTAVYTFRKHDCVHGIRPCRRALNTAVFTVRTRLCTRAVNTPVYRVHSRARPCTGHGRTMYMALVRSCTQSVHGPGHVPCTWTALYTGRKHGRVQVHDRVHGRVPVHGCVCGPCIRLSTAMYRLYTAVHGPCTWSVHDPNTAVYEVVHGVYGPCTPRHNAYQASHKLTTEICWTAITQIHSADESAVKWLTSHRT